MKRTSVTDPLLIVSVTVAPEFGRIGITFCPGKKDRHGTSAEWDRDLAADLDAIRDWGAVAVVTLLEAKELELLKVQSLGDEVLRRDMAWFHLPIVDVSTPDEEFELNWGTAGQRLRVLLQSGFDVVVHCRGGLGRAGTIAARLLVELGVKPVTAVAKVRKARPGAIETKAQEAFVMKIASERARLGENAEAIAERDNMDWFERLTGFREASYKETRAKLEVNGQQLRSRVNGKSYGIGKLELVPLEALRERVQAGPRAHGRLKVKVVTGDVRQMHKSPDNTGAVFQVASQFNLLEMIGPTITPEHGVTRYQSDPTQGPACAIAAGAATIYRNYFAPVRGFEGQTKERQLDGLAALGEALSSVLHQPVEALWEMRNGYALCTRAGLDRIAEHLRALRPEQVDILRGKLHVGVHPDVEVTDADGENRPLVTQVFCSALPVAYADVPISHWGPFASLILEAAYEATLWAAVLNAQRGASNIVLLTSLGGGAFRNSDRWIFAAIRRALQMVAALDLEVRLVSYGTPPQAMIQIAEDFGDRRPTMWTT
jgi:protein-tyrosine phosphatase